MTRPIRPPSAAVLGARATALQPMLLALLLAAAALLLPRAVRSDGGDRYPLDGSKVTVYDLVGRIRIEPASDSRTTVDVSRAGRDAGRLKVDTGVMWGRQTLRVVYPGNRIVYPELQHGSRTTLHVRDDATFGDGNSHLWNVGRQVAIVGSGSGLEAHADLLVRIPKGQDLILRLGVGEVTASNVDGKILIDVGSARVTTTNTQGGLAIDTGSGDVRVSDAEGPVSIDTGSGDVEATKISGGALSIDTGSGGVEASELDVSSLHVDTGSGGVQLSAVRSSRVDVDTGSGEVDLDLMRDIESLSVDTGSGGVTARVPHDVGAMLSLETGSGGFDVDLPITNLHRDSGELRGQIGDGRGRIVIETGSGGIRLLSR